MRCESAADAAAAGRVSWGRELAEVTLIAVIFAAAGAWPAPDINETVYLIKARHAADSDYGAGDFFLETPEAHGIFYLLAGPLTAALPLDTAAWIGRLAGWLSVAIGFHHLAVALVTGRSAKATLTRLAAAAMFSAALRFTPAAGEWVIGGFEAKVFAWGLVLGGLGELVRGGFARAWCLMGGATAFHPVVGGWAMLAAALAAASSWRREPDGLGADAVNPAPLSGRVAGESQSPGRSGALGVTTLIFLVGVALAVGGIAPVLTLSGDVDPGMRAEAARIYVVERLPHHLLPRAFEPGLIARHALAIVLWWLLDHLAPASRARKRLTRFTLAVLGISLAGLVISAFEPWAPAAVHGLLRYYWFRLADVVVPLSLAISAAAVLADDAACRRLCPAPPPVVRGLVGLLLMVDLANESRHWPLPGRENIPRSEAKVEARAWADICGWVREHVAAGTCAVTPRGAASFIWRTGLPEVVAWKNSPQDAASLVEWRRRITDCFSVDGTLRDLERSTAALGAGRLREVAHRYGARIAIVPLDSPGLVELPFQRLHANDRYAVLDLTKEAAAFGQPAIKAARRASRP